MYCVEKCEYCAIMCEFVVDLDYHLNIWCEKLPTDRRV